MSTRTFQAMLNEYLPNELLFQELIKRDYILQKVKQRTDWKGGTLIVPFRGAQASSIKFGGLTSESDISESTFVRGTIADYVEAWGTMSFNHRDLLDHSGKIPESTFLRILPDEIERFIEYMKMVVSIQLGTGPHFATLTADGDASGNITVDKIDRFNIGQKIRLQDGNTAVADYYVIAINVNTSVVTVSASRGGAAADVSAYTTSQNAKVYHDGLSASGGAFTSITSALLSAANGGSSTLHGVSKLAYPHLQAVNVAGSSITASNILDKLFDAYSEVRKKARGNANTFLMSYKHLGSVMKQIELAKGPFSVSKQPNASLYGWTEIEITSVKGALTLVGVQEWSDSEIAMLDWNSMCFNSNGGFKKRMGPNGNEYFEVRSSSAGFKYLVDVSLFGEMSYEQVGNNGIIYGISY